MIGGIGDRGERWADVFARMIVVRKRLKLTLLFRRTTGRTMVGDARQRQIVGIMSGFLSINLKISIELAPFFALHRFTAFASYGVLSVADVRMTLSVSISRIAACFRNRRTGQCARKSASANALED